MMTEMLTLREWLDQSHTQEEYQNLFLNMDMTMHYIHDHGYGIVSKRNQNGYPEFDINRIQIFMNNNRQNILFQDIDSIDPSYQKQIAQENIYSLSYLAVKSYANFKEGLNHDFLKKNFSEFTIFLPTEDVPYYRGVITSNATVYYSAYVEQRTKRVLQQEGAALQGQGKGSTLTKATDVGRFYSQLDDNNSMAAFIHLYVFPAIILFLSLMIPLIAWVFALIEK